MESPVVTSAQMRAAEEAAFARNLSSESLMDEAAAGIARAVSKFFTIPGHCLVFAGKGNNAGDAFAAAYLLREVGWTIELRCVFPEKEIGPLAREKLRTVADTSAPVGRAPLLILDGLLGLGATPPLRGPIAKACREINHLRRTENAFVFAIDLPTGLDGDSGQTDADCVIADFTLTIGFAKRGLVADHALDYVGRIVRIPLTALSAPPNESSTLADSTALRVLLPRRNFGAYKNQFGRVGILAGSTGLTGAAVLCASGALRGGAGLVELFVPKNIYDVIASTAPPEVMVKPISSYASLLKEPVEVWAIGPGLGQSHAAKILSLIKKSPRPMVIDADALNLLAKEGRSPGRPISALIKPAGPRLLTPHPGEMSRLLPAKKMTRAEHAKKLCAKYPVTLLFKGSRTLTAERDRPLSYNTTGNPGMATGGMGDILTGACAALIAQNLIPYDAARLAAWLCGRAAEIAIFEKGASEESLLPTDVLKNLGPAFENLRQ
ncbi:MAG: NAD(P)H-hydrate dehydratase [Chthoniobacterales bacterium]